MGLFAGLGKLLSTNLGDLVNKEDPERLAGQVVDDMEKLLAEPKKQAALATADHKRLTQERDEQQDICKEWERKAMLAVRAGGDDLAHEALRRRADHERQFADLARQTEIQRIASEKLKLLLQRLGERIDEAKRRMNQLIARQRRPEGPAGQPAVEITLKTLQEASAYTTFSRMARNTSKAAAETEAEAELGAEFKSPKGIADPERALADLKAKMGHGPA